MLSTETQALIWSNAFTQNYCMLANKAKATQEHADLIKESCLDIADFVLKSTLNKFKDA